LSLLFSRKETLWNGGLGQESYLKQLLLKRRTNKKNFHFHTKYSRPSWEISKTNFRLHMF